MKKNKPPYEPFWDDPNYAAAKPAHTPDEAEICRQAGLQSARATKWEGYTWKDYQTSIVRLNHGLSATAAQRDELLAACKELFKQCAMVHKYWGENCNQRESDAAIAQASAAIARVERGNSLPRDCGEGRAS